MGYHQECGDEKRQPKPNLDPGLRQVGHDSRSEPGSEDRATDHQGQGAKVHHNDRDENEGFEDDWQHASCVHGAWDEVVGDDMQELVNRGSGSERTHSQRVHEVGEETDT